MKETNSLNIVVKPSERWKNMRSERDGKTMKLIFKQLLYAVDQIHSRGITHRDIKPSNLLVNGKYLRLADFGSAVDEHSLDMLYSMFGPTQGQETLAYAPPEVVFGNAPYNLGRPWSYDMWSIGVMWLEVFLADKVFQLDERTAAIVLRKFEQNPKLRKEHVLMFRSLIEYCIVPSESRITTLLTPDEIKTGTFKYRRKECGAKDFARTVKRIDRLDEGIDDPDAIDFVRKLLRFSPFERMSAAEALNHPYLEDVVLPEPP